MRLRAGGARAILNKGNEGAMQKSQRIITTALWSVLVLTMVAVVGRGMWSSGPAAREISASNDAPIGEHGLPLLFSTPEFELIDQNGKPFKSSQLKGNVWVAAFIFTKCPGACPMMTRKLATLQNAVPKQNVQIVTFSVDPKNDTPAVLKEYATRLKADESRWHLLTGEEDAIFKAAAGLNLSASPAKDGQAVQHAEQFLLVDAAGQVRGIYNSNQDDKLKELARDADRLAGS